MNRSKGRRWLTALAAYLVGGIVLLSPRIESPAPNSISLSQKLSLIKPGISRAEVEALLTVRDGGAQGTASTRYYESPDTVIEVSYDQTGGTWSSNNRVSAPPALYNRPRSML